MALLPLFRPDEFFRERAPLRLAPAFGIVLLVAVATTAGTGLLGMFFADQIEGTITVDNENRPPDWVCDDSTGGTTDGDSAESMLRDGCDEPKTREVSASKLVMDAFVERLPLVFVSPFIGWVVIAGVLHLLSSALGGSNGFRQTLAVTGWGMVPSLFRLVVVVILGYFFVQGVSLSSDPEVLARQVQSLKDTSRSLPMLLIGLAEVVWQGYVWAYGLKRARDMNLGDAGMAAGVLAVGMFLLDLL